MAAARPLKECRVLCTAVSYGKKDPRLRVALEEAVGEVQYNPCGRPLKADELIPLIREVDGYVAGIDEVNAAVIRAAHRLAVIACYGVGIDRVDLEAARSKGIIVTNSPGTNSVAVAELALSLMLSLARRIPYADAAVRRGEWPIIDGIGLRNKTVGIVGLGAIGREVCKRLAGFECVMIATDVRPDLAFARRHDVRIVNLDELLGCADFVSLHIPASFENRKIVDDRFLSRMKVGSFLINTARGDLIDEEALVNALEAGHLAGAGLDCFSSEPPAKGSRLLRSERVILTPHSGSHTDEALNMMGWTALTNCLAVLRGEDPPNRIG